MIGRSGGSPSAPRPIDDREPPPTLRDPAGNAALREQGYVVLDLLDEATTDTLLGHCREVHPAPPGPGESAWQSDFYTAAPDEKRRTDRTISEAMAPAIAAQFVDHRTFLHNFVVNWPGDSGGMVLHQHPSVVDEREFRSAFVWCALNDATEANGTLHVVPGSHALQKGPHPERSASWWQAHERQLLRDHLVSVPLRAGQAIVFDNQLLHCSFANGTTAPRLTVATVVLPRAAEALYFERLDDRRTAMRRPTPEFFFDNAAGDLAWASPEGLEIVGEQELVPFAVTSDDVARLLPAGTCRHEARA